MTILKGAAKANYRRDISTSDIIKYLASGLTIKELCERFKCSRLLIDHRLEHVKKRYGAKTTIHLCCLWTKKKKMP